MSYSHSSNERIREISKKFEDLGVDDVQDSGLGSMTPSDAERLASLDRRVEGRQDSVCLEEIHDSGCVEEIEERLESDYESLNPLKSVFSRPIPPYTPYIPDPKSGYSKLHESILDKEVEEAIKLIEDCPEPACLDLLSAEIHTSLHLAVYSNLPEIVRFLIVYGANFNSTDRRGNTALHTACELGRLSCVRMILSPLDEKESIGLQENKVPQDVNEKNFEGLTPLHLATINNHPEVVSLLLSQSTVNADVGDSTSGRTALHHALERRHKECFKQLLKSSADVNATTYDGCSPLHLAVGLEMEQETRYLMTRGADVQIATSDEIRATDLARSEKIKDALHYSSFFLESQTIKQR